MSQSPFAVVIDNGMIKLFVLINFVVILCDASDAKQELSNHFAYDDKQLTEVSGLLLRMKELAHSHAFGNRQFGHDSASDSKKDVSISIEQPKTTKKLTPYLFEGDILLSTKQAEGILENIANTPTSKKRGKLKSKDFGRSQRSFSSDPEAKWTEFPIRYRFHESLAIYQITQIINALNYWQAHTCITFQNDDKASDDFIEFFKGEGCYSMIGRFGGRQGVSIGDGCERIGTIEHEVGHALGLWHEQSRPDAGQYIEVLKAFILPSYISDFLERGTDEINTLGIPYDLGSVMHYGSTAFSADQKSKTLLTRDPFYQTTIGQRETLSFYDVKIINEAYCKDKCKGKNECKNGGYINPSNCKGCNCPSGFGGANCEKNEKALESPCGGLLKATDKWQSIESPGYPDPGYESGEKCSWVIEAGKDNRIETEFIDDFDIFCASTCVDYVELKIGTDLRNTGFRFCCPDHPLNNVVSALNKMVVIFRSAIGEGAGFRMRFRSTKQKARMPPKPPVKTTTVAPTTVEGENIWSEWGSWSDCSKPCGGCGIRSRVRMCNTAECTGKSQEFSTCNLQACPVDPKCGKVKFLNRLCADKRVCTHLSDAISSCSQPTCCPPFYAVDGQCQSDEPLLSVFVR